jgi:mRNA-degrading endonuclease RelE of RelBE toxin-antitoxin system
VDKIKKFLRKRTQKEREILLDVLDLLEKREFLGLQIKKLRGTPYYRVRQGRFRIIFWYNENNNFEVEKIEYRKESTYKDL